MVLPWASYSPEPRYCIEADSYLTLVSRGVLFPVMRDRSYRSCNCTESCPDKTRQQTVLTRSNLPTASQQ